MWKMQETEPVPPKIMTDENLWKNDWHNINLYFFKGQLFRQKKMDSVYKSLYPANLFKFKFKHFVCHLLIYQYKALEFLSRFHSPAVNRSIDQSINQTEKE